MNDPPLTPGMVYAQYMLLFLKCVCVCVCFIRFRRSQTTLCSNSLSPFFHNNSCSCIFPYGRPEHAEYANEREAFLTSADGRGEGEGACLQERKPLPSLPLSLFKLNISLQHTHTHTLFFLSMVNLELILLVGFSNGDWKRVFFKHFTAARFFCTPTVTCKDGHNEHKPWQRTSWFTIVNRPEGQSSPF